jgi:hypothetical protein
MHTVKTPVSTSCKGKEKVCAPSQHGSCCSLSAGMDGRPALFNSNQTPYRFHYHHTPLLLHLRHAATLKSSLQHATAFARGEMILPWAIQSPEDILLSHSNPANSSFIVTSSDTPTAIQVVYGQLMMRRSLHPFINISAIHPLLCRHRSL